MVDRNILAHMVYSEEHRRGIKGVPGRAWSGRELLTGSIPRPTCLICEIGDWQTAHVAYWVWHLMLPSTDTCDVVPWGPT